MATEQEAERQHAIHYLGLLAQCLESSDWATIIWNEANIRLALSNAIEKVERTKQSLIDALSGHPTPDAGGEE